MTAQSPEDARGMDLLAGLVAEGQTVAEAARAMCISFAEASALWSRIVAGLGPQAS